MLRSLNVYVAWVFVIGLLGSIVLMPPVMLLVGLMSRVFPALFSHDSIGLNIYVGAAILALVLPAWRWRTQGLLPTGILADRAERVQRGERLLQIGHLVFFGFLATPLLLAVVLGQVHYYWLLVFGTLAIPVSYLSWIVGLYLINTPGKQGQIRMRGR